MLISSRNDGDWIEIADRGGATLRIRVQIEPRAGIRGSRIRMAFDDPERNFDINLKPQQTKVEAA